MASERRVWHFNAQALANTAWAFGTAGVSNVAGVLRTRQGRRLAVVLMLEAQEAERGLGPSLQEAVLQALWAD